MNPIKFNTLLSMYRYCTDGRFDNNTAFSFIDGQQYTYKSFHTECEIQKENIEKYGINPGDKVAILSQNMPNWPIAFFSAIAFGKICVPLLPDFSPNEINNILNHSESKALFVSKRLLPKLTEEAKEKISLIICMDDFSIIKGEIADTPSLSSEPAEDDLASIIYTSGTTGNSKGVMLSHRNFTANLYAAQVLRPGYHWDVWLSILPLSHTLENSLSMLLPMVSGSSVYYPERAPTPSVLMDAFKKVRPTTILSVPLIMEKIYKSAVLPTFTKSKFMSSIYKTLVGRKILNRIAGAKLKKKFGGRIRFFGIGGAKLDPNVEQFLLDAKFPYAIGYGLTETSPLLAGATPDMVKHQSTGPAVSGVQLRIDNPNPQTGEGEIVAKGDNVMMGYYKNPEATAETFTKDGWFRTKDLGIFDKKGWLYIKGRVNNMILGASGENIYPEEIESIINDHALVAESLVMEDKGRLVAMVHLNPDQIEPLSETHNKIESSLHEEKTKLSDQLKEAINEFSKNYDGKIEEFKHAFERKKDELSEAYSRKSEEITASYNKMKDEASEAYHKKLDQIKSEIANFVNSRVNKSSRISNVDIQEEQFEKTATQKIKRYLYTKKK